MLSGTDAASQTPRCPRTLPPSAEAVRRAHQHPTCQRPRVPTCGRLETMFPLRRSALARSRPRPSPWPRRC
jgi:hypothetical protein